MQYNQSTFARAKGNLCCLTRNNRTASAVARSKAQAGCWHSPQMKAMKLLVVALVLAFLVSADTMPGALCFINVLVNKIAWKGGEKSKYLSSG